jgi:alpha-glucosidase
MRYLLLLALFEGLLQTNATAKDHYNLTSPNGDLSVSIGVDQHITYAVNYKSYALILPSVIAMKLENTTLGLSPQVIRVSTHEINRTITPLYGKSSKLTDHYKELKITFKGNYAVVFRAYNQGIAYRFITDIEDSIKVVNETTQFNLAGHPEAVLPVAHNLTSWELPYTTYSSIDLVPKGDSSILPALFSYKKLKVKVVIAESDLMNYPGMYLQINGHEVRGFWPGYPSETVMGSWGNFVSVVKKRAPYIASTKGKRSFPWRVAIITDDDKKLLSNELIYQLASPSRLDKTDWIKPGKAAWEWWSDAMLPGAGISSGMDNRNTVLYKYYVDFAAKYHLEYVLIDAGWSNIFHLTKINPKIDIREVIAYARKKKVAIFLWCVASTLMDSLQSNINYIKRLGAAGIKVDFFDRNDQQAISWYQQIAQAAAAKKLMIDFHGCSEPTGLQRTYPNILNFEAVRGNECNKWDTTSNPDYHLLFPFIRMLGGPLDYTPGSMQNKTRTDFKPLAHGIPSTQGTRCHELAMYVLFDQPLAMLCGSPSVYDRYPDIMKFLSAVPTIFDDTKVLDAKLGEYALVAKRKEKNWYIGAMTNWDQRQLTLDFSFLPTGVTYQADVYTDIPASNADAEKYRHEVIPVNKTMKMTLNLASGGGAVIYLHS